MDSTSLSLSQALGSGLVNLIEAILRLIPQVIFGFIVLGLGLVIGNWAKSLIVSAVRSIHLENFFGASSLGKYFAQTHIQVKLESVLGELIRWIIIYLFLISALNIAGLTDISDLLRGLLTYIPHIISALFILIVGVLAAGFVEQLVKNALTPIDISTARLAGKASSYSVVIVAFIMAIGELGIAKEYIIILFAGFVAMIALSFGLATGLGSKDLLSEVLAGWYKKVKIEASLKKKTKVD
jgi:hypothetical protein